MAWAACLRSLDNDSPRIAILCWSLAILRSSLDINYIFNRVLVGIMAWSAMACVAAGSSRKFFILGNWYWCNIVSWIAAPAMVRGSARWRLRCLGGQRLGRCASICKHGASKPARNLTALGAACLRLGSMAEIHQIFHRDSIGCISAFRPVANSISQRCLRGVGNGHCHLAVARAMAREEKIVPVVVTALAGFYTLFLLLIPLLSQELMFDAPAALMDRANGELRPKLWLLLLDAIQHHPLLGYGWNEVVRAQLLVANSHPVLGYPFFQSHNLFFDFLIWTGIPVGMSISVVILAWVGIAARRISEPPQLFYFLMILVAGIHALFELPLHYAYFLLPVGVAMGALNGGLRIWELKLPMALGKFPIAVALVLGVGLLAIVIRDYFEIEETHLSMRLERSGIVNARGPRLPDVWILNQLMETQRFIRFEPYAGASMEQLKWAEDMVALVPSPRGFMKVAIFFGINQRPEESRNWLRRMCRVVSREQCVAGPEKWSSEKNNYPQLKNIDWPAP